MDLGVRETILDSALYRETKYHVNTSLNMTAWTGPTSEPHLITSTTATLPITSSAMTILLTLPMKMCVMDTHNVLTSLMRIKKHVQSAHMLLDIQHGTGSLQHFNANTGTQI